MKKVYGHKKVSSFLANCKAGHRHRPGKGGLLPFVTCCMTSGVSCFLESHQKLPDGHMLESTGELDLAHFVSGRTF